MIKSLPPIKERKNNDQDKSSENLQKKISLIYNIFTIFSQYILVGKLFISSNLNQPLKLHFS